MPWDSDPFEAGYDPGIDPGLEDYTSEYNQGQSDAETGAPLDAQGMPVEPVWLYGADHVMSANDCRIAGTLYTADELARGLTDAQKLQCDRFGKEGYYSPLDAPDLGNGILGDVIKIAAYGGAVLFGLRLAKVI